MANISTYDIWIPGQQWARVQPLLEPLNTPDGSLLRLPVTPWPATFTTTEHGDIQFSGEADGWRVDDRVGKSIGFDVFDKDGWTPEKFGQFIKSRRNLNVTVGDHECPTIVALAAYVRSQMLVVHRDGEQCWISFISSEGDASKAEYSGAQDGIYALWTVFLSQGVDAAMALPGVLRHPKGDTLSGATAQRAARRQVALREWKFLHGTGKRVAPQGAELTVWDLELVPRDDIDEKRPVIASARSSKHLYEVIYPLRLQQQGTLEVLCAVDGELQQYVDPATGETRGLGATCADWGEWILNDSVPGDLRAGGKLWEGPGAEAELYRLSKNIVEYEEHEASTSQFSNVWEMQAWLDKALGNSNAPLKVILIDDVTLMLTARELPFVQIRSFDQSESDKEQISYFPRKFQPWDGVQNWLNPDHGGYSRNPKLKVLMDGQTVDAFTAVNCLDANDLQGAVFEDRVPLREGSWFVLGLENTRTCIAFPAVGTMLAVTTDNDGASVMITAREHFSRGEERRNEQSFETQWAQWLDDDHQLTPEEIERGLKTLGELIQEGNS